MSINSVWYVVTPKIVMNSRDDPDPPPAIGYRSRAGLLASIQHRSWELDRSEP